MMKLLPIACEQFRKLLKGHEHKLQLANKIRQLAAKVEQIFFISFYRYKLQLANLMTAIGQVNCTLLYYTCIYIAMVFSYFTSYFIHCQQGQNLTIYTYKQIQLASTLSYTFTKWLANVPCGSSFHISYPPFQSPCFTSSSQFCCSYSPLKQEKNS